MRMATTGKYTATRVISIEGKTYNPGDDLTWWDRAAEFVGKSVSLEKITKRPDKPNYKLKDTSTLREIARAKGITVTWNMKRETIIERLEELD